MRKKGGRGGKGFLASGLSKKRLTVQPFRVKLLLEVVGFFSILSNKLDFLHIV